MSIHYITNNMIMQDLHVIQTYPSGPDVITPCNERECNNDPCDCTHIIKFDIGDVVQMVLYINGKL